MTRPTNNSKTPVLPQLGPRKRKEKTPQQANLNQESSSQDVRDVNLEDLSEECRALYVLLSRKLDAVIDEVRAKDTRLEKCERENEILRKKLNELEGRMDDMEIQGRSKNIIISGKTVNNLENDNLSQSAVQLLRSKIRYELSPSNIVSVYRIGAKSSVQSPDHRRLMLKLRDESTKLDILSACRSVKPADLYANDDLTPLRASLLYLLRRAKSRSNGKLVACGSWNGNVYAYIKPPNGTARNQNLFQVYE